MVRFLFNGELVDNPSNWTKLQSKLKRGDYVNVLLLTMEGKYDFTGTAYSFLYELYTSSGFCADINVDVQLLVNQNWLTIYNGTIILTDCLFNEKTCVVNCEIVDISYFAKIDNNKNVKACIDADRSKNGVAIDLMNSYLVDFTNNTNPLSAGYMANVPCYRIDEVFRYFIDFMTDKTLSYQSSIFEVGGEWEGLCITHGQRIRTGSTHEFPQFTFTTLFNEINKVIPIILLIENPFTSPIVRVENLSYLDGQETSLTLTDIKEIQSGFDQKKLYSSIHVGCPTDDFYQIAVPDTIKFIAHRDEEFQFLGTCNTDQKLELYGEWIRSTSCMRSSLSGNQGYDDNIFLIDTTYINSTSGETAYENYLGITGLNGYFYNARLTNDKILSRYLNDIPNSIASYTGVTGTGTFLAYNNATATVSGSATNPSFNFTNVMYNIGSNYNSFDRYVASDIGVFDFEIQFEYTNFTGSKNITATIRVYDDTGAYRSSVSLFNINASSPTTQLVTAQVKLLKDWYVGIQVQYSGVASVDITTNSYWKCTENTLSGGIWQEGNPDDYRIMQFTFDYPISYQEFKTIVENQTSSIKFSMDGNAIRKAYIKELIYDHISQIAKFTLIASKNQINAS